MKDYFKFLDYTFAHGDDLFVAAATRLSALSQQDPGRQKHVSLLGGSTVFKLFQALEDQDLVAKTNWSELTFWWGDERCVDFADAQSNYGELKRKFFTKLEAQGYKLNVEPVHCFPADQEHNCSQEQLDAEVNRLTDLVKTQLPTSDLGVPEFDLVLLGMGADAHTASLFPGFSYPEDDRLWAPASHPLTGQQRITMLPRLLNAAKEIIFLVAGKDKAITVGEISLLLFNKLQIVELIDPAKLRTMPVETWNKINEGLNKRLGNESPVPNIGLRTKTSFYVDSAAFSLLEQGQAAFDALSAEDKAKVAAQV